MPVNYLVTENDNKLITENGSYIILESSAATAARALVNLNAPGYPVAWFPKQRKEQWRK